MGITNRNAGNRILELRKKQGITQAELAELSDISIRTIQRIEANEVNPYDDTLKRIAPVLSVKISELKESSIPLKKIIILHLSPLTGLFIPLFQIFAPYLLWLFYRNEYRAVDLHIKDIIAFHLLTSLFFIFGMVLVYHGHTIGYYMAIGIILFCTSLTLWNAYRLSESKQYLYLNAFGLKK